MLGHCPSPGDTHALDGFAKFGSKSACYVSTSPISPSSRIDQNLLASDPRSVTFRPRFDRLKSRQLQEYSTNETSCSACHRRHAARHVAIQVVQTHGTVTELHPTFKSTTTSYQLLDAAFVPICSGCARTQWASDLFWLLAHVALLVLVPFLELDGVNLQSLLTLGLLIWALCGVSYFAHLLLGLNNTTRWDRKAKNVVSRRYRRRLGALINESAGGGQIELFSSAEMEALRAKNATYPEWTFLMTIFATLFLLMILVGTLNDLGLAKWH